MRFVTFDKGGVETVGVRIGQDVVDLSVAAPALPRTLVGLIQNNLLKDAGAAADKAGANARVAVDSLKYLPVIPNPPKFFGFGMNYPSHVKERPASPGFFIGVPGRLVGHNQPLIVPRKSKTLDFEVELCFVFSKFARHVKEKDAVNYIAGYSIFNDCSVRGYGGGMNLSLMKNSDSTGPFGPEFVTADELPAGGDGLRIQTRRNGKTVQDDNTKNMFWKLPEAIELISSYMSFSPGDVVTTGTSGGTVVDTNLKQYLANPQDETLPYLKAGEVIECEIEGIGVLRNKVFDEDL